MFQKSFCERFCVFAADQDLVSVFSGVTATGHYAWGSIQEQALNGHEGHVSGFRQDLRQNTARCRSL